MMIFVVGRESPRLRRIDSSESSLLNDVDNGVGALFAVDGAYDIVDFGNIDSRNVSSDDPMTASMYVSTVSLPSSLQK